MTTTDPLVTAFQAAEAMPDEELNGDREWHGVD